MAFTSVNQPCKRPIGTIRGFTRELRLNDTESDRFKHETNEWLKHRYNDDVNQIIELRDEAISIEASKFLDQQAEKWFNERGPGRFSWPADKDSLIEKVTAIMRLQVLHKYEHKNRMHREKSQLQLNGQGGGIDSDSEDGSDACSEVTNSQDTYSQRDYRPADSELRTQGRKTHPTRSNTQPGMPPVRSIETDKFPEAGSRHISGAASSRTRPREEDRTANEDMTSRMSSKRFKTTSGSSIQHADRQISQGDSCITVRQGHMEPRTSTQQGSCFGPAKTGGAGLSVDIPRTVSSRKALSPRPRPLSVEASAQLSPPQMQPFDRSIFRLSTSIGDDEFMNITSRGTTQLSRAVSRTSNLGIAKTPACEHTPPSSARASSPVRRQEASPDEDDVIEIKSEAMAAQSNGTSTAKSLTHSKKAKIFFGTDHIKNINKEKAHEILQATLDFLDERSLSCRRKAKRSIGSALNVKFEQDAEFMCDLLSKLRKKQEIWSI